jgi:hypothetical protein
MVERITHVIQIGTPCTKESTLQELNNIIANAGTVGNISKIRAHKTSTGIKDTFLETFLELMHQSYKSKVGGYNKQVALDNFRATLPENMGMLSPVWRIQGSFLFSLCVMRVLKFKCTRTRSSCGHPS